MKRVTENGIQSWELSEALWERVKNFIPQRKRNENKAYQRKPISPRRVVEACHSWLNRFRKLLVRYEKKARNYRALVEVSLCRYYLAKSYPDPPWPYSRISSY